MKQLAPLFCFLKATLTRVSLEKRAYYMVILWLETGLSWGVEVLETAIHHTAIHRSSRSDHTFRSDRSDRYYRSDRLQRFEPFFAKTMDPLSKKPMLPWMALIFSVSTSPFSLLRWGLQGRGLQGLALQGPGLQGLGRRVCGLGALSAALFLTACGGGGSSTPLKDPDIQSSQLAYGINVTFFVGVSQLNQGVHFTASLCGALSPAVSPSPLYQAFSCQPNGSGTLTFSALDESGKVLLTKNFTIPAPEVTMVTSLGKIVYELNPNAAPITVKNFLEYVSTGFYTNLIFHRVIPGFVVQGGGFKSGMTQVQPYFAPITLETPNGLSNLTGTLAMARTSDPNSATSQFYINLADNKSLDYVSSANPGYAVFGKVVSGLDVVNAIAALPTQTVNGSSDVPVTDVTITSATRTQ
jgi:cyclophilin family peptidyl-prolyl cis-trans isomerase